MSEKFYLLTPLKKGGVVHALEDLCPRSSSYFPKKPAITQYTLCHWTKTIAEGVDFWGKPPSFPDATLTRGPLKNVTCRNCIKVLKKWGWLKEEQS